jgi:hypothetical protein
LLSDFPLKGRSARASAGHSRYKALKERGWREAWGGKKETVLEGAVCFLFSLPDRTHFDGKCFIGVIIVIITCVG